MSTLFEHGTFHCADDGGVVGQFASLEVRFARPSVMLNVLSYKLEAVFIWVIILALALLVELNVDEYSQSYATPTSAILLVLGQPFVEPMVDTRLTLPVFPAPVLESIWRLPKRLPKEMLPQELSTALLSPPGPMKIGC